MPGLIGKKVGMTSVFSVEGKSIPCTVIEAGPCVVTQVKTIEKDGYAALQLGFDEKKEKNTTKPLCGHFKKAGTTPKRKLVEFSGYDAEYKLGDVIDVTLFEGTELFEMAQSGEFVPAGEKERIKELQIFIQNLQLKVQLFANSLSNFYPTTAYLPRDKEIVISELQNIIDTVSEEEMAEYRKNLKTLG